jgi:hypothetical protein
MTVALVAGVSCASDSSPVSSTASRALDAKAERQEQRREARRREQRREDRRDDREQDARAELPADLPLEAAVIGLEGVPPDLTVAGTAADQAFDEALPLHPARQEPLLCPGRRTITIGYETLPSEDVAGFVGVSPTGEALFVHVVARLDVASTLWYDFVRNVNVCTGSFPRSTDGDQTSEVERLSPIQFGRVLGVGYRQIVTAPGTPTTLASRYFMRNGRCISDLRVSAQLMESGQYVISEEVLQSAAERLNRVVGCSD